MNLLESVDDPKAVLASLATCLTPGGAVIVLVPQGKGLYGSLDRAMGHRRRFSRGGAARRSSKNSVSESSASIRSTKSARWDGGFLRASCGARASAARR